MCVVSHALRFLCCSLLWHSDVLVDVQVSDVLLSVSPHDVDALCSVGIQFLRPFLRSAVTMSALTAAVESLVYPAYRCVPQLSCRVDTAAPVAHLFWCSLSWGFISFS